MLDPKVAERLLLVGMKEEIRTRYFLLRNLLEGIAEQLGGEVYPIIKIVEGKKVLDYEIVVRKKVMGFLRSIIILRAYFLYGFSGDSGAWSDLRIALRKNGYPSNLFLHLEKEMGAQTVDSHHIRVEYVDYEKDEKEGFYKKL